jgi:hypothetical protein
VARVDARRQREWAEGRLTIAPAPRKKRTRHGHRRGAHATPGADPERLSFLAPARPPAAEAPAEEAAAQPAAAQAPPAELRREQARVRRAALIAQQLGERDLPFYLVDFMNVEDLAAQVGLEAAVATIARREGREVQEVSDAWHEGVERIAADERCRYVDALRPYIDRIESELEA